MGNGEKECFKTSPCEEDETSEEGQSESCTVVKDGSGSSSNSTVEESEKKPSSVRPYVRSKMPRLRWTPDLHLRFMHAVERLGGQERATPKLVLQLMDIKGLNIAHVKSHLQMYRTKKIDESNQGLKDQRHFMDGVDRNIYNLSQLPLLPGFINQTQNFSFPIRYGDAGSWNGHGKWVQESSVMQNMISNKTRPGYYGTLTERMLSEKSHYSNKSSNLDLLTRTSTPFIERSAWRTINEAPKEEYGWLHKQEPYLGQTRQNPIELDSLKLMRVSSHIDDTSSVSRISTLKRKASDFDQLDLNLSLGLESRNGEEEGRSMVDDDGDLALSLNTMTRSSLSTLMMKKVKEDHIVDGNARGASTLDLTL